jgi:hypothetical protein
MLLAIDSDEDFINEEGINASSVLAPQSACVNGSELDTPESNSLPANGNASFSEQIFDIAVT